MNAEAPVDEAEVVGDAPVILHVTDEAFTLLGSELKAPTVRPDSVVEQLGEKTADVIVCEVGLSAMRDIDEALQAADLEKQPEIIFFTTEQTGSVDPATFASEVQVFYKPNDHVKMMKYIAGENVPEEE